MAATRWTREEIEFLKEEYGTTTTKDVLARLNERFGNDRSIYALNVKANKMGLRKEHPTREQRNRRCQRTVKWSMEPELDAIMTEVDTGSVAAAQGRFEERTGIKLTRNQVYEHRRHHGRLSRTVDPDAPYSGGRRVPVGTERMTKDGIKVKIRERSVVPGAKDNWRMKKDLVWEWVNNRELPDEMCVVLADRDVSNLAPSNLVAVDKSLFGLINNIFGGWHDKDSLELAVASARLCAKVVDKQLGARKCASCGRAFEPSGRWQTGIKHCPECVERGEHNRIGRNKRQVRCLETGEIFESVTAAARSMDGTMSALSAALSRNGGKWRGFTWERVK